METHEMMTETDLTCVLGSADLVARCTGSRGVEEEDVGCGGVRTAERGEKRDGS